MWQLNPPLVPDSDEARDWAEQELAKAAYHEQKSWLEVIVDQLTDFFHRLTEVTSGWGIGFLPLLLLILVIAVIAGAFIIGGPARRRRRRTPAGQGPIFDADDHRTAAELRRTARKAHADGEFPRAFIEGFRALILGMDERAIGSDTRGRTAQEAVAAAATGLPGYAEELHRAAAGFDGVRYGELPATSQDVTWLFDLDERIQHARPDHSALVGS